MGAEYEMGMHRDEDRRPLRWIVLDAVGTLIEPSPDVATVYHKIGAKYGSRLSRDEVKQRFRRAFKDAHRADGLPDATAFSTSESEEAHFWRAIVADVFEDVADSEACFRDLFEHFAQPSAWVCFDDVGSTLQRLAERGFRLAIASNFDRRLHPVCDGLAELSGIECRVVSSEVGYCKPASGFFEAVLRLTQARPEDVLMVGDDEANDVIGARQFGVQALHLRRDAAPLIEQPLLERTWIVSLQELEALTP